MLICIYTYEVAGITELSQLQLGRELTPRLTDIPVNGSSFHKEMP